jgi:hypothetical protein
MNLDCLYQPLEFDGWKDLGSHRHLDLTFDLVGSRKSFGFIQWNILIKSIPVLDANTIELWEKNFLDMSKKSKRWFVGNCFILCLIAKEVSPDALPTIKGDDMGLFGLFRRKGGGGCILIADESNKQVYGKVPSLPVDLNRYLTSTIKTLSNCF